MNDKKNTKPATGLRKVLGLNGDSRVDNEIDELLNEDLDNDELLNEDLDIDDKKAEVKSVKLAVPLTVNSEIEALSVQDRKGVFKQLVNELTYLDVAGKDDFELMYLVAMLQVPLIKRAFCSFFKRPSSMLYEGPRIAAQRRVLRDAITLKPPGSQDKQHWFIYQEDNHKLHEAWEKMLRATEKAIIDGNIAGFFAGFINAFSNDSGFLRDWVSQNQQCCDYLVYRERGKQLHKQLASLVKGQNRAIEGLCDGYAQASLGLGNGPRGIFTLMGEPGTGKTFLAESFASNLKEVEGESFQFLRFNMEQYTDERAVASLFGSGHFYTEAAMGELTTGVYCFPKSVILFDEIEKAHPLVVQSLLSLLDRGVCQDSTSLKWVDFSQTFILFTTNLGSERLVQRRDNGQVLGTLDNTSLGSLLSPQEGNGKKGLSPEFINRLGKGRFLVFESLSPEHLLEIYKSSWNKCSNAVADLAVNPVECTSELAAIQLLKRLPDLSARTANSAAESDMVACLEPILEAFQAMGKPLDDFDLGPIVRLKGLEFTLNELLISRGLDQPEQVLVVDDDSSTEQVIKKGFSEAKLPINTKRIGHRSSLETSSKLSRPEMILIDLFIENDVSQQKTTHALNLIMELRSRFSDVPIIGFCRNPARSTKTIEAIEAAKSMDGVSAVLAYQTDDEKSFSEAIDASKSMDGFSTVLTYQSDDEQSFVDDIVSRLKHRRLARLAQAFLRERKRLQFNWHAKATGFNIDLEASLVRMEPIVSPGEEGQMFGLGEIPELNFDDVIGNARGVRQISRAIGWLQRPGRIGRFGYRPPGGYLLGGPPGTGKTFLARAAAGACELPFFSLNAADLLSPSSGMAESKLRQLFTDARRLAPSIIFIDEIDAIARQRGNGGYHSLVNTLLGEMDGFAGHSRPVLVLAATNFPSSLDTALTRPGRFDETIMCDLPNREARETLIRKGVKRLALALADDEEEKLVLRTQGESAASIDAALRHAVYIADGEDRDPEVRDVVEAFEHRVYGTAREDLTLAKEEKWSVACHEAGHALAIHQLFPGRTVDYITIQPRTGSLGFVSSREDSSNARGQIGMTRKEIVLQMAVCLAGREAERLMLGEEGMSTGAGSDLMKANNLARAAVMRLGLDPEIGPLQITPEILSADPKLAEVAHRRVKAWLTEAEESARNLLEQHRDYLAAVATKLNETESMEENEFLMLMEAEPGSHKLDLKH